MMALENYEPAAIDAEQQDNFGRWLASGDIRYREFMSAKHDNGAYYVLTISAKTFHNVKKVLEKDYYFSEISDSERAFMLYEDDRGGLNIYYGGGENANNKLFKFDRGAWDSRRKKHFIAKYGGYTMPDSLREFMEV